MTRRSFAGAVAAGLVLAALPAAAQTITWQMANEYPATSIHGEGDQFFARELSERFSSSLLTVQWYFQMRLSGRDVAGSTRVRVR